LTRAGSGTPFSPGTEKKCSFPGNIYAHPKIGQWKFRGKEGSQKRNFVKTKYEAKRKFQRGGGWA